MIRIISWVIVFYCILTYAPITKCSNRIPITYFLLFLSLFGIYFIQKDLKKYSTIILGKKWLVMISSFLFLFGIMLSPINSYLKNIFFLLFLLSIAISFHPIFQLNYGKNILLPVAITTSLFFIILTIISICYPQFIEVGWFKYLFFGLLSLILFRLVLIFFPSQNNDKLLRMSSYLGIVIFSAFVLYDTKFMIARSKMCNIEFNYVDNILNLFLDIFNLFMEILNLQQ